MFYELSWIVPYLLAGGVMWFVASQIATIGREISLGRSILAIIILGALGAISAHLLGPFIGYWHLLIVFSISIFVVKAIFEFSFKQAFLTVLVYWIVMIIGTLILYTPAILHSNKPE